MTTLSKNPVSLASNLIDFMVSEIRGARDVWVKLGEKEQNEVLDRIRKQAVSIVANCVSTVISSDRPSIECKIETVTIKKYVEAKIVCSKDDKYVHDLVDFQGRHAMIVLVDKAQYTGCEDQYEADPDQRGIDFS